MQTYKQGDFVDTTKGLLIVQCPITFKKNNNPKYNKLGGRTLYWLQNEQCEDVFFWDKELEKILTDNEKMYNEKEGEFYED